jgi:hypothetical protein
VKVSKVFLLSLVWNPSLLFFCRAVTQQLTIQWTAWNNTFNRTLLRIQHDLN